MGNLRQAEKLCLPNVAAVLPAPTLPSGDPSQAFSTSKLLVLLPPSRTPLLKPKSGRLCKMLWLLPLPLVNPWGRPAILATEDSRGIYSSSESSTAVVKTSTSFILCAACFHRSTMYLK